MPGRRVRVRITWERQTRRGGEEKATARARQRWQISGGPKMADSVRSGGCAFGTSPPSTLRSLWSKQGAYHTAARHVDGVSVYAQYMEEAEGVHCGVERGQDAARLLRVQRPQDFILLRQVRIELAKGSLAPGQVVDRPNDIVHVRWCGCGAGGVRRGWDVQGGRVREKIYHVWEVVPFRTGLEWCEPEKRE